MPVLTRNRSVILSSVVSVAAGTKMEDNLNMDKSEVSGHWLLDNLLCYYRTFVTRQSASKKFATTCKMLLRNSVLQEICCNWHKICQNFRLIELLNVDLIAFSDSKSEKLTYDPVVRISSKIPSSK